MDALQSAFPLLRWDEIASALDHDGFTVPDEAATALLLGAWQRATGAAFPAAALVGHRWTNTSGQLSFLRHAVGAPPHLVSWEGTRQLVRSPPVVCCQCTGTFFTLSLLLLKLHILLPCSSRAGIAKHVLVCTQCFRRTGAAAQTAAGWRSCRDQQWRGCHRAAINLVRRAAVTPVPPAGAAARRAQQQREQGLAQLRPADCTCALTLWQQKL